jgi:hypothetical protein
MVRALLRGFVKMERTMGGFGSGRPRSSHTGIVEGVQSIDVNQLHRRGALRPGLLVTLHQGEKVAIKMITESDRVNLFYRVRTDDYSREVTETVRLVRVPCRLGGTRPYFVCPGMVTGEGGGRTACERRVAKLYFAGCDFLCRDCAQLAYASQSYDRLSRSVRRAGKIRQRLGGDPDIAAPFPPKPKGMWRRTYERWRAGVFEAEEAVDEAFTGHFERLLARDKPKV